MSNIDEFQASDYRTRKLVGILGLILPFILSIVGGGFLASISHYYYTDIGAIVFIIILSTFVLFLISYKGYGFNKNIEMISDDFITKIGGFTALIVVIIPINCLCSHAYVIDTICENAIVNSENLPLLGHSNPIQNTIHLISAGVFLFCMGWMSKYKFPRGGTDPNTLENIIYRICDNIVWISLGSLILNFLAKISIPIYKDNVPRYLVYIMETIAIVPFGISWLVKGLNMDYVKSLRSRYF